MTKSMLELALDRTHAGVQALAAPAHAPEADRSDRRHETDWFYAITAQHLAAAGDVLLPHIRRLPGGRGHVTAYVRHVRTLECALRLLKARQYGDSRAQHLRHSDVWRVIDRMLADHELLEAKYVRLLGAKLDSALIDKLAMELHTAEQIAPTRAHPHSPHTGRTGRLAHRMWRIADTTWDDLEGRVIPTTYAQHPQRDSAFSLYLRGGQVPLPTVPPVVLSQLPPVVSQNQIS
ncbi:hypothetical protein BWI15_02425 [Kribbella sp. ALI-6-A]|uniref:hypothetical protein n=1 Tax=Kribbella sp. ALI-6-A TaxID=1933817 RepID=UPI00097BCCE2|nr:hypothetical protein [Kribbella sp. ALI-6-A]ONI78349.1 hypothetical protein BWI15_02425 [Kribbella sp. ALI-6-A]